MISFNAHLLGELDDLATSGLLRQPRELVVQPQPPLVLCSNDYLGYGTETVNTLGIDDHASGAGASRLVSGDHQEHRDGEQEIAHWLGHESALLLSSGYAANVGVLSALANEDDVIISDALNHASIIDGCRLSRARVIVADHLNVDDMARCLRETRSARARWLVTESYFSMEGDTPDMKALRAVADEHDAFLVVDEAHAIGIFGEEGAGRCQEAGVLPDVLIGTLGKALGLAGAFVAGSAALRSYLWNRARSFVFSTASPPWLAAAAGARVARVRHDRAGRKRLWDIVSHVRAQLQAMGAPIVPASVGPILPWLVGDSGEVVRLRDALLDKGLFVQAIRPPTVPDGTSRLRFTLHAKLTDHEIQKTLATLSWCLGR